MSETHPKCHMTLWPCGHTSFSDKLKTKYLLSCEVCGYQTSHMNSRDRERMWWYAFTWQIKSISTLARSMALKLAKLVTYDRVKKLKKSHVPEITWSNKVKWQTKNQIFLASEGVWPPNLAECRITLMASYDSFTM